MADEVERRVENGTKVRIAAALVLLALLVAFVLDNTDSVTVGFVFTDRRVPLIFVLLVTAVVGALIDRIVTWARHRADT